MTTSDPSKNDVPRHATVAARAAETLAQPPAPPPPPPAPKQPAGTVNCYGEAFCDPNAEFCIKYFTGSQANPEKLVQAPSCYQPVDCNGMAMDCTCIKQDASLGPSCVNCVDNGNSTYSCYAQ